MPFMIVWPDLDVGLDAERRILGREPLQALAHLLLVVLGLRLDRDLDHRLREGHRLEDDGLRRIAERVTGRGVLQARQRDDVAGEGLVDLFAVDRVHHHHPADALALLLGGVHQLVALLDRPGVDPGEGERADEGVVHDLEGQAGEGLRVVGRARDVAGLRLVARLEAHVGRHVERATAGSRSRRSASAARPCS